MILVSGDCLAAEGLKVHLRDEGLEVPVTEEATGEAPRVSVRVDKLLFMSSGLVNGFGEERAFKELIKNSRNCCN